MSKNIKPIAKNINFTAINIGSLNEIEEYSMIHPKTGQTIKGKQFIKDASDATGTEISFTTVAPKSSLGYFHHHNQNEETYVVLTGCGQFQVDDEVFDIAEGSIIRVAPDGKRSLCNTSESEPLVYMVVQSKEGSLEQHTTADGGRDVMESKMKY